MFIMKKFLSICRGCLSHYNCIRERIRPPVGKCSLPEDTRRDGILQEISRIVEKEKVVFLRHPVKVREDFIGTDMPFTVVKVGLPEGASIRGRDFLLGTDAYGSPVWTSNVTTDGLNDILQQIQ